MNILVTGSCGLIGSEAVAYFASQGHSLYGIDNNMRQVFFGTAGDTTWNLLELRKKVKNYTHFNYDIRNPSQLKTVFDTCRFDTIIHCASQPSHDKAREIPLMDFEVNALGTVHLLETARRVCPNAVFILMSTNKVYGDAPNERPLKELATRYDYADEKDIHGISEDCRIDRSLHSLFGASKAAADLMAQEYGRTYGMKVGIFRGGCLTGPAHSAVELHGFISYLAQVALTGKKYTVYGYLGKQVRDQIHSYDVIKAMEVFIHSPRGGEVYNIGGGRSNSASVIESIDLVQKISGKKISWTYHDQNRLGDHICYISDTRKFEAHYPSWRRTYGLEKMVSEIVERQRERQGSL